MTDDTTNATAGGSPLDGGVRPGVRYVLCPGMVTSQRDGQSHYIGAMQLARLYGVSLRECEIYEPAPWWPRSFYEMAVERQKGLPRLTPRYDGDYSLPSGA